jgi:hypothetical protein
LNLMSLNQCQWRREENLKMMVDALKTAASHSSQLWPLL